MHKFVNVGVLGLVLGVLGFTGCTAKYERLLEERDREIAALRDERSRLEVEVRGLRAGEEALQERAKLAQAESERLRAELGGARQVGAAPAAVAHRAVDPELDRLARESGFRVEERAEGTAIVLPGTITFRSGSAELTAQGKSVLDRLATTIRQRFASRIISVEGHTDAAPIRKSKFGTNWRLSAERAERVREHLASRGLGENGRIRVVGYGPTVPVANNNREEGRQQNRRVELVILNS